MAAKQGDEGGNNNEGATISKKQQKKQAKEAQKAAKKVETSKDSQPPEDDVSIGKYGSLGLIRSTEQDFDERQIRVFTHIKDLTEDKAKKQVWIRARVQTSRAKGKQCFIVLRQQQYTVQGLIAVSPNISKAMVKFASNINKESIIDVLGEVSCVPNPIDSCTQKLVELHIQELWEISAAKPQLPLLVEDAARPVNDNDEGLQIRVNQDTRLDNRILDLRTPANQAIFRLEAGVCKLFRDILTEQVILVMSNTEVDLVYELQDRVYSFLGIRDD